MAVNPYENSRVAYDGSRDVKAICEPFMKKLGLTYFHYTRFYNNGNSTLLITKPDWCDFHYRANYRDHMPVTVDEIVMGEHIFSLWEGVVPDDVIYDAQQHFDITKPLGISRVLPDYVENFSIAGSANSPGLLNQYFSHVDEIIQFTKEFTEKAEDLIVEGKKEQCSNSHVRATELDDVKIIVPEGFNEFYALTKKEKQVLQLLVDGNTANRIAALLCRSVRTVETHINNLKTKLDCRDKFELVRRAITMRKYF